MGCGASTASKRPSGWKDRPSKAMINIIDAPTEDSAPLLHLTETEQESASPQSPVPVRESQAPEWRLSQAGLKRGASLRRAVSSEAGADLRAQHLRAEQAAARRSNLHRESSRPISTAGAFERSALDAFSERAEVGGQEPKTAESLERIRAATATNPLFMHLTDIQCATVYAAMFEVRAAAGQEVISQGERGELFYVVESGLYDAWVICYEDGATPTKRVGRHRAIDGNELETGGSSQPKSQPACSASAGSNVRNHSSTYSVVDAGNSESARLQSPRDSSFSLDSMPGDLSSRPSGTRQQSGRIWVEPSSRLSTPNLGGASPPEGFHGGRNLPRLPSHVTRQLTPPGSDPGSVDKRSRIDRRSGVSRVSGATSRASTTNATYLARASGGSLCSASSLQEPVMTRQYGPGESFGDEPALRRPAPRNQRASPARPQSTPAPSAERAHRHLQGNWRCCTTRHAARRSCAERAEGSGH